MVVFLCYLAVVGTTYADSRQESGKSPQESQTTFLDRMLGRHSTFPNSPITILVPAAPGGGWDQLARVIQNVYVRESILDVPMEVENRGGAGGLVGLTELVTQHRRSPYILMVGGKTMVSATVLHNSHFTINDATPLALLATEYSVVAVSADSPYQNMGDLLTDFRANPADFVWGGGAAGGADHLLIGSIAKAAGIDPGVVNFVAYSGGGESATSILTNQVKAAVGGPEWRELAEAGRVRFLAVSSPERLPDIDAPTLREVGLDVQMDNWRFILAPPGIPQAEKEVLLSSLQRMQASSRWAEMLKRQGLVDRFLTGDGLDEFLARETLATASLLKELKILQGDRAYSATGPYLFPSVILALTSLTVVAMIVRALLRHRALGKAERGRPRAVQAKWRPFATSAALILGYILALKTVGFLLAAPVAFVLQARLIDEISLRHAAFVAIVSVTIIYFVFERVLSINLP